MKRLIISGLVVILFGITAYTTGFVLMVNNGEPPQPKLHNHTIVTEAPIEHVYTIRAENGVLVVYDESGELYDRTCISLSILPRDIQIKVLNGYVVNSDRELYRLLETYST